MKPALSNLILFIFLGSLALGGVAAVILSLLIVIPGSEAWRYFNPIAETP